jgi:hypothetical protein
MKSRPQSGRINGAFFTDDELNSFSEQGFLQPMDQVEKELPRIASVRFLTHCLPTILDPRGETADGVRNNDLTWLNMWAAEISENTRLPVVLTGENGEVEYTIPPPMGTIFTGRTGHPDSIEGRFNYFATHSRHLISHAEMIHSRMFNAIQLQTEENDRYRDDWLRLLADSGQIDAEFPAVAEKYRSKEPNSITRYLAGGNAVPNTPAYVHPADAITPAKVETGFTGSGGGMDYD